MGSLTDDEVTAVIALLRAGHEWSEGGEGDYMRWRAHGDQFEASAFDQGRKSVHMWSEAQMRSQIVGIADSFRRFLRSHRAG